MAKGHKTGGKVNGHENRKTAKASCSPSKADLHWAAGFIEGEGSFGGRSGMLVTATQVEWEPIGKLLYLFGGNVAQYRTAGRPAWRWTTTGSRARGVALTLYPLLSVKRKNQIRKAMKHSLLPDTSGVSYKHPQEAR